MWVCAWQSVKCVCVCECVCMWNYCMLSLCVCVKLLYVRDGMWQSYVRDGMWQSCVCVKLLHVRDAMWQSCVCVSECEVIVCEVWQSCVCVWVCVKFCMWSYCMWEMLCDKVVSVWVCVREAAGGGGEGARDTESKTRTPHKVVGKNAH